MARVYGQIVDRTGWTLDEIDALTLDDVADLYAHWREEPPLSDVVRALARWQPPEVVQEAPSGKAVTEEEFRRIVAGVQADAEQFGRPG